MGNQDDIFYTASTRISCSGTDPLADHPTIYLEIDKQIREISCPYCERIFKLTE